MQSGSNVKGRKRSTTDKIKKDNPLKCDVMELISEEELSVCKSEGSPPRKKPRAKKEKRSVICPVPIGTNQKKPAMSQNKGSLKVKADKVLKQRGGSVAPESK